MRAGKASRRTVVSFIVAGVALIVIVSFVISEFVIGPDSTNFNTGASSTSSVVSTTDTTTITTTSVEQSTTETTSSQETTTFTAQPQPTKTVTVAAPPPPPVVPTRVPTPFVADFHKDICGGIQVLVNDTSVNMVPYGDPVATRRGDVLTIHFKRTDPSVDMYPFKNLMIQSQLDAQQDAGPFYGLKTGATVDNLDNNDTITFSGLNYESKYVVLCEQK